MDTRAEDVTDLLQAWGQGERAALDRLMPLLYAELRRLAHAHLRNERRDGTIATTALVNEAYLRLVDQKRARVESRNHFLSLAAQIMRRILVDESRRRDAAKRGSGAVRLSLHDAVEPVPLPNTRLAALDDALVALERVEARLTRLVELRYFGGLTLEEAADVLQVSRSTAARDWQAARAWLYRALSDADAAAPGRRES